MWQRAQELQPSNYTDSINFPSTKVHRSLNKKIPIDFLLTFLIYSGMPLQHCPSLPRLLFSCMLVWMRLISKSGNLPVTGQLNLLLTYKYLFCLWILRFVVSDLQPWEIHLHKLNFARISSGGKSCFFPIVLLVQLNEKRHLWRKKITWRQQVSNYLEHFSVEITFSIG